MMPESFSRAGRAFGDALGDRDNKSNQSIVDLTPIFHWQHCTGGKVFVCHRGIITRTDFAREADRR